MSVSHGPVCCDAPPGEWEQRCAETGDLFHSPAWQSVLAKAFGCTTLYLWDAESDTGCALPLFRFGPLRVGYLGFPAGGGIGSLSVPRAIAETLPRVDFSRRVDALRVPVSGFGQSALAKLPAVFQPETAILGLERWEAAALPSALRRNLKKFSRSNLDLRPIKNAASDGARLHRLYLGTIERHRGRRRYSRAYFEAVVALSRSSNVLRCTGAYAGDQLAAFIVAARSGPVVFYLHGASDPEFQQARPSDALFQDAIEWARAQGAEQFNMMASPASQRGLVRFKEKWGGTTRAHRTCTLACSWIGRLTAPLLNRGATRAEPSFPRGGQR